MGRSWRSGGRCLEVGSEPLQVQLLLAGPQVQVQQDPDQHPVLQRDHGGDGGGDGLDEPDGVVEPERETEVTFDLKPRPRLQNVVL